MKTNGHIPIDFDAIRIQTTPPPRPKSLRKPNESVDDAVKLVGMMLTSGQTVALGGISAIGADLHLVPIISILHLNEGVLHGWALPIGHPKRELAFNYIDVANGIYEIASYVPDTMVYFVGSADPELALPDAAIEDLCEVARFIFPFISDQGPPPGTDW